MAIMPKASGNGFPAAGLGCDRRSEDIKLEVTNFIGM